MAIATNNNVKFLLGLSTALPTSGAQQGAFYLTTDDNRLYIGNGDKPVLLNEQVLFVDSMDDLPKTGKPEQLVFIRNNNVLCGWDSVTQKYAQINPDSYITNITTTIGEVTDKKATVTITAKDNNSHQAAGTFALEGGDGIVLTKNGTTVKISASGSGGTGVSVEATQKENDNTTAIITQRVKSYNSAGDQVGEDITDSISIKAGENMESAVVSGGENTEVITLNAKEQGVKTLTATNGDTSGFSIGLGQSASGDGFGQKTATIDPVIKIDNNGTTETAKFVSGTADLSKLASKTYVTAEILKHEKTIDALQFKGIITDTKALPAIAGGTVKVGYVYKIGEITASVTSAVGSDVKVGDLVIATEGENYTENNNGFITGGGKYELVPSGDEITYSMIANNTKWTLTGSDSKEYGAIDFKGGTDLTVSAASASGVQTVTFNHATKTAPTPTSAGTVTTASGGAAAEVTVVTEVTPDSTGHLSEIKTKKITMTDTGLKTVGAVVSKDADVQKVSTTVTVQDTNGTSKSAATSLSSDTLAFTVSGQDTAINMIWGSF